MRIANIIVFHEDPPAIERLVKSLTHPHFDFYLHLDKKVDVKPFLFLAELPNVFLITNRKSVRWAGFSQLEAVLTCIEAIVKSNVSYGFVNLLSGQDYPIKPASKIYDFLQENQGKSFMISESAPSEWWDHASTRFTRYHFVDYSFRGKFRFAKLVSRFLPKRKFPLESPLFGGPQSAYWIMSLEAAKYILNAINKNDKNLNFYKHTWGSDEFLINTLLMDSPFRDSIVNENYHLIDRSNGSTRPKVLTADDFQMLKDSHKFFARKFNRRVDEKVLDMIDEQLLSVPKESKPGNKKVN